MGKGKHIWTASDDKFIQDNYLEKTDKELSLNIPDTTENTIRQRRIKLGYYRKNKNKIKRIGNDKVTFEMLRKFFDEKNYLLLSEESDYINQSSKLKYQCKKHMNKGVLEISGGHLISGRGCPYCGRERTAASKVSTITPEFDKKLCESKNFTYVKTEKESDGYYIVFICPHHSILGEQRMKRGNMARKEVHGCKYCSIKELPSWYVELELNKKYPHYQLLSSYSGMNQPLTCKCIKHNLVFTKLAKYIYNDGTGCELCIHENRSLSAKLQPEEIKSLIKQKNPNIEAVSIDEYESINSHLKIRCLKCNHEWISTLAYLKKATVKCPKCGKGYKGEQRLLELFDELNLSYKAQYRIEDCKNKRTLPFDGAIFSEDNSLKALFEYNGEQHYKPVDYFGGEKKFKKNLKNDQIKKEYCFNHNIPLLIIPYWDFYNMESLVKNFINSL